MLLMKGKSSVDPATNYTKMIINTECIISRMSSYDLGLHRLFYFGWHFFIVGKTYSSQVPFSFFVSVLLLFSFFFLCCVNPSMEPSSTNMD